MYNVHDQCHVNLYCAVATLEHNDEKHTCQHWAQYTLMHAAACTWWDYSQASIAQVVIKCRYVRGSAPPGADAAADLQGSV